MYGGRPALYRRCCLALAGPVRGREQGLAPRKRPSRARCFSLARRRGPALQKEKGAVPTLVMCVRVSIPTTTRYDYDCDYDYDYDYDYDCDCDYDYNYNYKGCPPCHVPTRYLLVSAFSFR